MKYNGFHGLFLVEHNKESTYELHLDITRLGRYPFRSESSLGAHYQFTILMVVPRCVIHMSSILQNVYKAEQQYIK